MPARVECGREQAQAPAADRLQSPQPVDDVLERLDPVAEPRRLLVAEAFRQVREPLAEPRQGAVPEQVVELRLRARGERSRGERRLAAAPDRPERARLRGHDEVVPSTTQVHASLLPAAARVGRRLQLADQAHLLEGRLELRAEDAPLDAVERMQGRLDRRPLTVGAEVRAQARPQIARSPDVQHLVVAVAEEVDAGPGRSAVASERFP